MPKEWLNIDQSPEELAKIHQEDYYWYLRSQNFINAFIIPIGQIVDGFNQTCLDVGCSDGVLSSHCSVPYCGIDGSSEAIERARIRIYNRVPDEARPVSVHVGRFEDPKVEGVFPTVVFGGIMEVLVKPQHRVDLLKLYEHKYKVERFIIYDLTRLDTSEIEKEYGKPTLKLHRHAEPFPPDKNVPDVKLYRKILVYSCQR